MAASDYPNLLSPIVLGKQFFKHRIFASPQDNPQLDANTFSGRYPPEGSSSPSASTMSK